MYQEAVLHVLLCFSITVDEAVLNDLCWVPFGVKTLLIDARGGSLYLQPPSDELGGKKENTIFVEVPPNAVSTSANVKMRYAIIPSGSFTLPEGYQLGSPAVYIYYDGRRVTKPLKLHLPHWYGGEDYIQDGLSFAIAPHSLEQKRMYHFKLLAGGEFLDSHYGVVGIGGHCSLFAQVFNLGATPMCFATLLEKEQRGKTECNIAVTYASPVWPQVIFIILIYHYCIVIQYRMRLNYSQTKLSRMKDFTIFAVFIFADALVPNIILHIYTIYVM